MKSPFDARPLIVAIAGSNGAGKTTFFHAHLAPAGLRFVNADDLARELDLGAYAAADLASKLREELINQRESFIFETVLSDPLGEKVALLKSAAARGSTVVMVFIGVDDARMSEQRVAMRAIRDLPHVLVFDNGDLANPYRKVAELQDGKALSTHPPLPAWFPVTKKRRSVGRQRPYSLILS